MNKGKEEENNFKGDNLEHQALIQGNLSWLFLPDPDYIVRHSHLKLSNFWMWSLVGPCAYWSVGDILDLGKQLSFISRFQREKPK